MNKQFIGSLYEPFNITNINDNILSLYIHIPFCDHICSYCDFKKMVASNELKEKYILSLIKDLEYQYKNNRLNDLITIYIGGGTPSSLPFNFLKLLLEHINKYVNLNKILEFTIEINPNDLNENNIKDYVYLFNKYHINRISLGVQSFNDKKLKLLRRNHNKEIAINSIKLLQKNGIDNINVDLIYGFTLDNIDLIKSDLDLAIELNIKHISYYSLILEENTILYHQYKNNEFKEMDDDLEADIYNFIYNYLKEHNYNRYEISNFSLNDYESLHNIITWKNLHYIGIGVNASYYFDDIRYTNIDKIIDYINYINNNNYDDIISEMYYLENNDIMYEEIMLGLRLNIGIDINKFNLRFNKDLLKEFPVINDLIKENILIKYNINNIDFIKIRDDLMYLQNTILLKILES